MTEKNEAFRVRLSVPERQYVKVYQDFLYSELLSAEEKMVYIALKSFVSYGSDEGKVFPSIDTLCKVTSMSKSTVIRTIKKLEEKGIVKKNRRGVTKTNIYVLADNHAMWKAKTAEELKQNSEGAIDLSTEEMLEELKRRGIEVVTKKELPSATVEGSDESSSVSKDSLIHANHSNTVPENQEFERYSMQDLHQIFGYAALDRYDSKDIDAVFNILYDVLNTRKETVRVGGENRPTMVVVGKLMKLDYNDIGFAIKKFNEQSGRIKNPSAYMLTQLYVAREQNHLDLMNQGHHNGDF